MMEQIGREICRPSDQALAVIELQRDLLFQRIPEDRVRIYADRSLAAGLQQAERFAGRSLDALCREKHLEVIYSDAVSGMGGVNFRAKIEYEKNSAQVILFRKTVIELADKVNPLLQPEQRLDFKRISEVMTAHEFFHYLELTEIGEVADSADKVEIIRLFGIRRYARIARCGEVAAHMFAKTFLQLPFLPNYLDYLYLVAQGKWTMELLIDRMNRAERIYNELTED